MYSQPQSHPSAHLLRPSLSPFAPSLGLSVSPVHLLLEGMRHGQHGGIVEMTLGEHEAYRQTVGLRAGNTDRGMPSAESSDLFWHDQMRLTRTAIIGIDPCFQFVGTQQPVRFRDGPLAMDPFGFNRVEPRTFAGQVADDEAHPRGTPLDLLIVLTDPVPHGLAAVPRGIVPDQQQRGEALRGELGRAPGQKIDRHRTHGAPGHKPEPHLVGLQRSRPPQQAITGQRLRIGIVRRQAQLLQLVRGFGVRPAMLVWLGQATPPDLVAKAQRPRRLDQGPLDQAVPSFFFRA
jgi:hypothetical protein